MSTITQNVCDRRGKNMKYDGWTGVLPNVFKHGKIVKIRKLFNGNPDGYSYSDKHYELCAECTKELEKFLEG